MNTVRQLVRNLYIPSSLRLPISDKIDRSLLIQKNVIFETKLKDNRVIFEDGKFGILEHKISELIDKVDNSNNVKHQSKSLISSVEFYDSYITFENVPTAIFKLFFDSARLLSNDNIQIVKNINMSENYNMMDFFNRNHKDFYQILQDKSEPYESLRKLIKQYQHRRLGFSVKDENWNGPSDYYNYQNPETDGERFKLLRKLDREAINCWSLSFLPTHPSCYAELGFSLDDYHQDFLAGISNFFGPKYQGERMLTGTRNYGRSENESKNNSLVYSIVYLYEAMKRVGINVTELK